MSSTQDLDSRLRTVEDKLDFVMKEFKVQSRSVLPTLDALGRPQVKVETHSLLDIYHAVKNGSLQVTPSEEPTKESENA